MMNKEIKAVKPDIEGIINSLLPDNLSGQITPKTLRDVLHKMSLVMQNEHASMFGGGFVTAKTGIVTHYTTGQTTPFFDAWVDPAGGSTGITSVHDKVVVDASVYFEVRGADSFKIGYAIDGVPNLDYVATMSAGNNNIQFRAVIDNPPVNKDIQLYILPTSDGVDPAAFQLIKIDMHLYGIKVGKNV